MELYNELKELILAVEKDADAFYNKNNKAAGTRVRNAMQEIKGKAQDIRVNVLDVKKTREEA
ncbi:histone H1 [Aureibacter tunicatorum]|uniref:Histone H1-like protein Hc1 n=1 Tax=Aureibacter tunicatorum TaxID=866807 RepID=A0AAE3XRF2_9BACT|nr:histone H1 [Aureibacter tunicatorum]MDR6240683.1 hypothetical protein [Aureibacter tunicatorum]BDD06984.1 hypothetical protein AUTU_44670 [Aureibacter tunicatorum]